MPDKKLTDSEIVKALEICQKPHDNDTCNNCKYKRNYGCRDDLCNDILDLINRLQAENDDFKFLYENLKAEHLETIKAIKYHKAEAYKEVTEKIDATTWYHINKNSELVMGANSETDIPLFKAEDIFNLLKELVGE